MKTYRNVQEPPLSASEQGDNWLEVVSANQRIVSGRKNCEPRCWETPRQFALHAAESMAIFLFMAVPAVGLDFLVRSLQDHGTGSPIVVCLKTAEYAFVGTDLLLILAFLWRTISRTIRKL